MKRFIKTIVLASFICLAGFAHAKGTVQGVVNLNTATKQEILLLPGIGDVKAEEILKLRAVKPFTDVKQLVAVRGIGDVLLAKIVPHVVLDGKSTIAEVKITAAK